MPDQAMLQQQMWRPYSIIYRSEPWTIVAAEADDVLAKGLAWGHEAALKKQPSGPGGLCAGKKLTPAGEEHVGRVVQKLLESPRWKDGSFKTTYPTLSGLENRDTMAMQQLRYWFADIIARRNETRSKGESCVSW